MRDYSRPHATMTTRRQRVRPRPRWSNAVSLVAAACACASTGEAAPVTTAPRVLGATIQDEARVLPNGRGRRLAEPLEGIDATGILRQIGQIDCPNTVNKNIRLFLDANKIVIDACTEQTGYTLYPYGTKLPDADQTNKICNSPNCLDLFTGVVLAKLPECEYQGYSPRSFAESFLRVRDDLLNDRRPPTAAEFGQLYALNRVVNYLTENTTIQASVKPNFKVNEVAAALSPVHVSKDIVLTDGFVVMVNTTTAADSSGSVHAAVNATATKAPTSVMPAAGSNSSELTNSAGSTKDGDLPENLETAYLYTGLLWFFINVMYYWTMIRKGSDNY